MDDKMLFLNNSIDGPAKDFIGFDTYVNKIDDAINCGAQMIAITSPFGSGKTSLSALLKKKREDKKREKFLSVQMWSELNGLDSPNKVCELHKNFLYQMGSAIHPAKGTYINRRLSNNYGLLKIHANRPIYWIALVISMLVAALGWVAKKHSNFVVECIPNLEGVIKYLPMILFGIAIALLVVIVTKAEIIFSSKNSEKQREVEADEIIDLYRHEIINKKGRLFSLVCKILKRIPLIKKIPGLSGMCYIITIEDLDRTDNGSAVIGFLKELRKYYLPTNDEQFFHQNRVIFIVNIKPESFVIENMNKLENGEVRSKTAENGEMGSQNIIEMNSCDLLYSKLFDYVLNLQTIHMVDYDIVLCALLEEKRSWLNQYSLSKNFEKLSDIPGMQWMIHGVNVNIREIKKRLNLTAVIYETLINRFPDKHSGISFQKCAAAAYIITEYEKDFAETPDTAFDELNKLYLQKELNENIIAEKLSIKNARCVQTIYDFITSNLIGEDYRMYFYNYPKNSNIYSSDEMNVQNAILYGTVCKNFEDVALAVVRSNSDVVRKSLKKICQLQLPLPQTVIKTESLFLSAVSYEYNAVLESFGKMNVNAAYIDKNIANIINILQYDSERNIYNENIFKDFCGVWEKVFDEPHILKLREELCVYFSEEILLFKPLFIGEHSVITQKEMDLLSFDATLQLLNTESKNFTINHVKYIIDKFTAMAAMNENIILDVSTMLTRACGIFSIPEVADCLLEYMLKTRKISHSFEKKIFDLLISKKDVYSNRDIDKNQLFVKYKQLINIVVTEDLYDDVLDHIARLDDLYKPYEYSIAVAQKLYSHKYYLMSTLIKLNQNYDIDFSDMNMCVDLEKHIDWFHENQLYALSFRKRVLDQAENIKDYLFFFTDQFPVVSKEEFSVLENRRDSTVINIFDYIPSKRITEEAVEYIVDFLNQEHRNNNIAIEVLRKLTKYSDVIIGAFFEKIDFVRAFSFYTFSKEKRDLIKSIFVKQLKLDTYRGQMKFMEMTKYLDEEFELRLLNNMDQELEQRYVNLIEKKLGPKRINSSTIKNLKTFKKIYIFSPSGGISKKMLEEKEYIYYVISTTLYAKKFVMNKSFDEVLWPVYIEIYSNTTSYSQTRGYMKENIKFLERIVESGIYADFSDTTLSTLCLALQNEQLITYVFDKGTNFAVNYFGSLKAGFIDYGAAKVFVDTISLSKHTPILVNDMVRDNIYDRLVDPVLKAKYTRLRKAAGCKY